MFVLKKENNVRETDDTVKRDRLIKEGYKLVEPVAKIATKTKKNKSAEPPAEPSEQEKTEE